MKSSVDLRSPKVILVILGIFLAFVLLRLLYLVVFVGAEYSSQAQESRSVDITTTAKRGTIYDRNGIVLASSVDATTIYCNPGDVKDAGTLAAKLAEVLGGDKNDYIDALTKSNTSFAYIKRQADVSKGDELKQRKAEDPNTYAGIYFLADSRREYPNGSVAGQIIGLCDVDGNGLCGLELEYEEILAGTAGHYTAETTRDGTAIPGAVTENTAAVAGQDIMITIDVTMQAQMEEYVKENTTRLGKTGSSIMMDAESGEILAMCSYPFLDPSNPSESPSGSENVTCVTQATEPGSMMKTVTALGVLQAGKLTPESIINVPAALQADEFVITDSWEHPAQSMTLDYVLTMSSNMGISLASDTIGAEGIYDNLVKSQILDATGIDFPGEAVGFVNNDWANWADISRYNYTFGQGLTCTPLEICRFYGAIVNDGVAVTPHLLMNKVQTGEVMEYETTDLGYKQEALDDIQMMLKNVVDNNESVQAGIDGYDICGKTSTAEYAKDGVYVDGSYNIGFTGFVDNASMKLVCYTGITEVSYSANTTLMFHDIMKFAIDRYSVVNTGKTTSTTEAQTSSEAE